MTRYTVTLELKTPLWKKVLRFFRLVKQREEFDLMLNCAWFEIGDHIDNGVNAIKVITKFKVL